MSIFKRKVEPTLHDLHAGAEQRGAEALGLFHAAANELRNAAVEHEQVAGEAHSRAVELLDLHDAAEAASEAKYRQADAIAKLVG